MKIRFLYLTDTHLGGTEAGYTLQPRCWDRVGLLFDGLSTWLRRHSVDFILHGGDVIDHGTACEIKMAVSCFSRLGVPTYLCLGNHDLAQRDSMDHWRSQHGGMLPDGADTFALEFGEFGLFVLGHHWYTTDPPHYWQEDKPQIPLLDDRQRCFLESFLATSDRPVIVATHSPLNAVPSVQTGMPQPFHSPDPEFVNIFRTLARKFDMMKLILCGHNHANSVYDHGGFVTMTTASFTETPFDVRTITVCDEAVEVETISLADLVSNLPVQYRAGYDWVMGGSAQRQLTISL